MRAVRVILNWLIVLTCPVWSIFLMLYCIISDLREGDPAVSRIFLKGAIWIWE